MSRLHEQDADAKQRILYAAKRLFATQGFDGTTVRQICEEASANVALVSYYFGGKEKVFEEVLRTFVPVGRVDELEDALRDPVEGVKLFLTEVLRLGFVDPQIRSILYIEIAMRSPRLSIVQANMLPLFEGLRTLLKRGRELGSFRFEDLDQTLLMVIGTLFIHSSSHYFEPIIPSFPFEFESLARETCRFVLAGLGCHEERTD